MTQIIEEPLWVQRLRDECQKSSQAKVAKVIGYSTGAISQILHGKYGARSKAVEKAVRGAFMGETVDCPVLGELEADHCIAYQRQPYANTNPTRIQLFKACKICDNRREVQK